MNSPLRPIFSQRQVAKILGIAPQTVHWHEKRALKKLRKGLEAMLTKEEAQGAAK